MQSTCYSYQILTKPEFPQHILKNTHMSNFVKIQPVGAELFHVDRQMGWRDRHDEAKVTLHNSAIMPKTCCGNRQCYVISTSLYFT
jgi:hypothetical protein